jgi:hypothetical protein
MRLEAYLVGLTDQDVAYLSPCGGVKQRCYLDVSRTHLAVQRLPDMGYPASGRRRQTVATQQRDDFEGAVEWLHAAHMRKMPKRGSGIGAPVAAARPRPRTRRVSSGSIRPSSQRRAVL